MEELSERIGRIEKSIEYMTKLLESIVEENDSRKHIAKLNAQKVKALNTVLSNIPGVKDNPLIKGIFDTINNTSPVDVQGE